MFLPGQHFFFFSTKIDFLWESVLSSQIEETSEKKGVPPTTVANVAAVLGDTPFFTCMSIFAPLARVTLYLKEKQIYGVRLAGRVADGYIAVSYVYAPPQQKSTRAI